jgi:hypothetical protein
MTDRSVSAAAAPSQPLHVPTQGGEEVHPPPADEPIAAPRTRVSRVRADIVISVQTLALA